METSPRPAPWRWPRSAVCVLLGAMNLVIALLGFVEWAFSPSGPAAFRWLLAGRSRPRRAAARRQRSSRSATSAHA